MICFVCNTVGVLSSFQKNIFASCINQNAILMIFGMVVFCFTILQHFFQFKSGVLEKFVLINIVKRKSPYNPSFDLIVYSCIIRFSLTVINSIGFAIAVVYTYLFLHQQLTIGANADGTVKTGYPVAVIE